MINATPDRRTELAQRLLQLTLAGAGLGVAGRGIMGLRNLAQEPSETPFISPGPSTIPVPIIKPTDTTDGEASPLEKLSNAAAQWLGNMLPEAAKGDFMHNAIAVPASVMAAGAGIGGGWKLTDWLLKRHQKKQMQDELEGTQADYQRALADQALSVKASAEDPYGGLDAVYDALEKKASFSGTAGNITGALALANLIVGGGAAMGTYNWAKGRSQAEMLAKAQKERARRLWAQSPQPVFAVPQEVKVPA